ncbi:NDR1/HIN1-like protein 10 [Fagus crenata]
MRLHTQLHLSDDGGIHRDGRHHFHRLAVLHPRFPEFQVESVSLTNFSASNSFSSITGNWNFRFSVTNPNKKMSISYDVVQCLLFYNPEFISETRIPPTIFLFDLISDFG